MISLPVSPSLGALSVSVEDGFEEGVSLTSSFFELDWVVFSEEAEGVVEEEGLPSSLP